MGKEWTKPSPKLLEKTHHLMHDGFHLRAFPDTNYDLPEALGDARWTDELIASTWYMAELENVLIISITKPARVVGDSTSWRSKNCLLNSNSLPMLM